MQNTLTFEFDENNDMAVMIDAILTRPGIRIRYMRDRSDDWISLVGDEAIEYGLRQLPEREQQIIEKYFLQNKSLLDISKDLDIPTGMVNGYLKAVLQRLIIYA